MPSVISSLSSPFFPLPVRKTLNMNQPIPPVHKPNYFVSVLKCQCPRCRTGSMFLNKISINSTKNMAMSDKCSTCGQPFELEVGFYYGTGYVSYALTVAITVATFIAFWVLYGISIRDNSLYI